MVIKNDVLLAPYTSFAVGGPAEHFALVENANELEEALRCTLPDTKLWTIGYGSNSLISDHGLPGMVLCIRGGTITVHDEQIIADAGAWWDDVVTTAIKEQLWGIELLSEVPGSVGAATFINITAYGQSIGNRIVWVEVWNRLTSKVERLAGSALTWGYKESFFQLPEGANMIILRVCLQLSRQKTDEITYQKALDVAHEQSLDTNSLSDRRAIIIEARMRAGSLWRPNSDDPHTVGSFFRNPLVPASMVDMLASFEEMGKTSEEIRKMNHAHGGDERRVSAAHVMLAAGFKRGQTWGSVKLNDNNLLKIEALAGTKAQDIYNVMRLIQDTCERKLGIRLEPEARILGEFTSAQN